MTNTFNLKLALASLQSDISNPTAYAQSANEKFNTTEDTITPLVERFAEAILEDDDLTEFLSALGEEFRNRNPQYNEFSDMYVEMARMDSDPSQRVKMKQLLINAMIQRVVDPDWVLSIVGKFDPFFVNAVRLYPLTTNDDTFAIWDGQHTTFSLLCIAMYGFGLTLDEALELEIPTNIHPSTDIAKLRQRFIGIHDNTMTKPLDKIDLYMQYVWSVRNNGDTNPWSMRFEEIQSGLEEFNCFFTHEKFSDAHKPGAISRPSEIYPTGRDVTKWKSSVLRRVFQYHNVSNPEYSVEPLEIDNMAHIFRACDQQGINVDDNYVKEFSKYLGAITNNTWAKGYNARSHRKHKMVLSAYKSWLKRQSHAVKEAYNDRCNQTEVAPTWICQAMKFNGFPYDLPLFTGKFAYKFNNKELS